MKKAKQNDITLDEVRCNQQQIGEYSEAEGCSTKSIGDCSHAEGCCTEAKGMCSHSEGCCTKSVGECSHSEGRSITINGNFTRTKSVGKGAHAEGGGATAGGDYSHAEGGNTIASGTVSHAEGISTQASGFSSHAEGCDSEASGECSHAEGCDSEASGKCSHVEGCDSEASGECSHAEGRATVASGFAAHAEGSNTTASGRIYPHAEGLGTTASGVISHAEGNHTTASGDISHAEGVSSEASGDVSHAEGGGTTASGEFSHAEGSGTEASGEASHAQGFRTEASGMHSHAEGVGTSTAGFDGTHIMGRFGDACEAYGWFMAGGINTNTRAVNACIKNSGDTFFASVNTVDPCCADYAEMFETIDGKAIDVGYFVTLEGKKIRKANDKDDFILGVTSATPALLAGAAEYTWQNRYIRDKWGRIQYEEVTVPVEKDKQGNVIIKEHTTLQPIMNPEYHCSKCYTSRRNRPEWIAVGLLGQVLVRDDGSCEVNGYCKSDDNGIATKSDFGYRVLERRDKDQILILLLYHVFR